MFILQCEFAKLFCFPCAGPVKEVPLDISLMMTTIRCMQNLKPLLDSEIPDVSRISLGMKKFSCIDYKLGELVKVV